MNYRTSRRLVAQALFLAVFVGHLSSVLAATNEPAAAVEPECWSWHVQNTDIVQYHPGFPAKYSGLNSLSSANEVRETVSLDLVGAVRLWRGAEAYADCLVWQGFGFSKTVGVEAFPNGEAFRLGTDVPDVNLARLFLRQTFGFGTEEEPVQGEELQLGGPRPTSRLTLTVGKLSAKDIFDFNEYANDPRTQFLNWAFMANEAWDYPADSLGYITGFAAEFDQPAWAVRYGFFQMPKVANGVGLDEHFLQAWGMVAEGEWRYELKQHPGAIRLLAYLNHAHMGSYEEAVQNPLRPADIEATRDYRYKYGFGLNLEQELTKTIGVFGRLGWSDGRSEAWAYSDVDRTGSLGLSVRGDRWHRPKDTLGIAGALNAISRKHRDFFAAGGLGILAGDGNLNYGWEKVAEIYYDFQIWKTLHFAIDYQYISNPAFNRDRGPVLAVGARVHWSL